MKPSKHLFGLLVVTTTAMLPPVACAGTPAAIVTADDSRQTTPVAPTASVSLEAPLARASFHLISNEPQPAG